MMKQEVEKLISFTKRVNTDYINQESMESFIYKIVKEKINFVIDVRNNTYYKPDFRPSHLKEILKKNDINYKYLKTLGNPYHKRLLQDLKRTKSLEKKKKITLKAKALFLNYLKKRMAIHNGENYYPYKVLKDLYELINSNPSNNFSLICYCKTEHFLRCHRFWIKEALIKKKRKEVGMPYENYRLEA